MKKFIKVIMFLYFIANLTVNLNVICYAANNLQDSGFESSTPNGTFPDSGAWTDSHASGASGSVCTTTATKDGVAGLWEYTGNEASENWSGPYQEFTAHSGDIFHASGWIRTQTTWVVGSSTYIQTWFLSSNHTVLTEHDGNAITTANTDWTLSSVTTAPAPSGTSFVRFILYLKKPENEYGQSIANFDTCSLEKTLSEAPIFQLSTLAVGFADNHVSKTFYIKNDGTSDLSWNLAEDEKWMDLSPSSGTLNPDQKEIITVDVSRIGLSGVLQKGSITFTSNGGNAIINVYVDMPGSIIPKHPSIVSTNGTQLLLQKRLSDGSLDISVPYIIKGVTWSPASIGTDNNLTSRRNEFQEWYVADIQLMKEMGVNTVYCFLDFGTNPDAIKILDNLYKFGIMVIMTTDENGTNNTTNIEKVVDYYKNHPAILMWAIGNEWNINLYHKKFETIQEASNATENATQIVKSLDSNHPVASIYGEINITDQEPNTDKIINTICSSVDIWGVNIYRGGSFGTLFTEWASITTKPFFLSEYGTDSFNTSSFWPVVGFEDETMQSDFNHILWLEIQKNLSALDSSKVCLGGTCFEWNDEWWKVKADDGGDNWIHDNSGFPTEWNLDAHPDSFANEEYFGLVGADRKLKKTYTTFKNDFSTVVWVDFSYTGSELGTQSQPFNTLEEALIAVTESGEIIIKTGTSRETFIENNKIKKRVTIKSSGGTAIIGK